MFSVIYTRYPDLQVAAHSSPEDCWVSIHGYVYDISKLISDNSGQLVNPLIKAGGSDISHWFQASSASERVDIKEEVEVSIKMCIDLATNTSRPHAPSGRFLHALPANPNEEDSSSSSPWWNDHSLKIGKLSQSLMKIRLRNVLTCHEHLLEVPREETIAEIRNRYLEYNWHADSYVWKFLRKDPISGSYNFDELILDQTLEQNGILEHHRHFEALDISSDFYVPVIHLYYIDDLSSK